MHANHPDESWGALSRKNGEQMSLPTGIQLEENEILYIVEP